MHFIIKHILLMCIKYSFAVFKLKKLAMIRNVGELQYPIIIKAAHLSLKLLLSSVWLSMP